MPLLSEEDKRNTLGAIELDCLRCGKPLIRHYCRQCDDFFLTCACPKGAIESHEGHRVDRGDRREEPMSEDKIKELQTWLLADAERWAEAVEQNSPGAAREYMARIERFALAINKERTKIGAAGQGPGRLPLLVRLNMERLAPAGAAMKQDDLAEALVSRLGWGYDDFEAALNEADETVIEACSLILQDPLPIERYKQMAAVGLKLIELELKRRKSKA
jgi:hypothetical protein